MKARRPIERLLALLAAAERDSALLRAAEERARGLDPSRAARLTALGLEHRLAARVGARGARGELSLGGDVAESFARSHRQALADQALVGEALSRLGEAFSAAGLRVIALKGSDLAFSLYGPGERVSNDLDLLVEAERADEARELLESCGYASAHPRARFARSHWFAEIYRHRQRPRLLVDLHWALGQRGRARWDLDGVFARARPHASIPGLERLGELDALAFLALHAVSYHGASDRWVWWLDLALASRERPLDDASLLEHAAARRARRALEVAALRVDAVFGPALSAERGRGRRAPFSRRARVAAMLGRFGERAPGGAVARRAVAALVVDDSRDLVGLFREVLGRR